MALTEYYVDPSIDAASGSGTVGDPYGDLQHAFDTVTRDSTNGDRFNIKAGTSEILAAALTLATYGTPTDDAPLVLQGYTSAQGDGGQGVVDGNATSKIWTVNTYDYIHMYDMRFTNTGANDIVRLNLGCTATNCVFDNSTSGYACFFTRGNIINCHCYNFSGTDGFYLNGSGMVAYCHIENSDGRSILGNGIRINGTAGGWGSYATGNIIQVDSTSNGIFIEDAGLIFGNTIWSNGGTGSGIVIGASGRNGTILVINNIVEGFSGVGGIGYELISGMNLQARLNNAAYNNTTNYSLSGADFYAANNESLGASPFTDAANDDFTIDTTVKATAYPTANYHGLSIRTYLDKGGLQREEAGAGGEGPLIGGRLVR